MRTSITTILWGKIHTLDKFGDVLSEINEVGYDGVGLETRLLPLPAIHDPALVKSALGKSGVENAGSYSTMKDEDIGWARRAGTSLLWVVARGDHSFDEAVDAVGRLVRLAAEPGIRIALHNHLGTPFETEAQMRKALKEIRGVEFCLDTAHAEAARIDTLKFIRDFGDRIALVHVKDLRARVPKNRVSFTRDFVNMGDGIIEFGKIFAALKDAGYGGSLMLETEALGSRKPSELAREGYERIQSALREA